MVHCEADYITEGKEATMAGRTAEDTPNNDMERFAQGIFDGQPFSGLLGAELTVVGSDNAEISVRVRPELTQQHGFVHGGVLSYLADNSLTFAGGMAFGGDALTAGFTISYVRPAKGPVVVARAETVSVTRSQAVCRCSVYDLSDDGGERLVAVAQGTISHAHSTEGSHQ
jgi:uncharacterized protein (TIGR00369 family)